MEYLEGTSHVPQNEEVDEWAHEAGSGTPGDALPSTVRSVRDLLACVPGATDVSTSGVEASHQREGVCQDLAHLTLAGSRALVIPARYVSGDLRPDARAAFGEKRLAR